MVHRLQRRLYCSNFANKWGIKQVRKSNFDDCLGDLKNHISDSDFVSVSLQTSGLFSLPWHRVQPFDNQHTAYCKAKYAAEKFQILQFAVCPFSVRESNLIAHPYNFHLFPRDELNIGMPSYSFSCQVSHLSFMAREGFDFDRWIDDGISYLSRAQEYVAKVRMGFPTRPSIQHELKSSPRQSVADSVFIQRVKSRVKHWKDACSSSTETNDALLSSLRKLIIGSEQYGSRPSLTIDVCSERQVLLVLELLSDFSDDIIPVVIPAKGGGAQAIRAILTSSKEDKILLEKDLQNLEEQESKRFCGFREVIDMISASQKPVVSYNSLNDFSFIHSKFLAPLPPTIDDFASSLRLVFPHVLDVNHLMSNVGSFSKRASLDSALSSLKNHHLSLLDMDISGNKCKLQRHDAVRVCHLFATVCSKLQINLDGIQSNDRHLALLLKGRSNVFSSFSTCDHESIDWDTEISTKNTGKVSCKHLVFLWGFRDEMASEILKTVLQGSHEVFCEEFDLRFIDKCAVIVFGQRDSSEVFLNAINSDGIRGPLKKMVAEGLRAAGYETYNRVCSSGLWEANLGESLERALSKSNVTLEADHETNRSNSINLSDL